MDEERQETADWRIVWQMFFPCVISDLIGGCVEVLGHLNGNMGRIVSSLLTVVVIYPFYWRRIQKKKENRRIAEADGMKEQVSPQIKTTKGEKSGYFWEKMPDAWKILLGAAAFSAVFNMIFWALEKKEIFLGVLHIAVQKVRMTGQAAGGYACGSSGKRCVGGRRRFIFRRPVAAVLSHGHCRPAFRRTAVSRHFI